MKLSWTGEELAARILEPINRLFEDVELLLGMELDSTSPEKRHEQNSLMPEIHNVHTEKKMIAEKHPEQDFPITIRRQEKDLLKSTALQADHVLPDASDEEFKSNIPLTIPNHAETANIPNLQNDKPAASLSYNPPESVRTPIGAQKINKQEKLSHDVRLLKSSVRNPPLQVGIKTPLEHATFTNLIVKPTDAPVGSPPTGRISGIPQVVSNKSISPANQTAPPDSLASLPDVNLPGHLPLTKRSQNRNIGENKKNLKNSGISGSIDTGREPGSIRKGRTSYPKPEIQNEMLSIMPVTGTIGMNTTKKEKGMGGLPIIPRRVRKTAEHVVRGMETVMEQAYKLTDNALTPSQMKFSSPSRRTPEEPPPNPVNNTFNVNVSVAQSGQGGKLKLDREVLKEAIVDILRDEARRHGLEV